MDIEIAGTTFKFTKPKRALLWTPPTGGGIYMMMAPVTQQEYQVLYVGETGSFARRGIGPRHRAWNHCVGHTGSALSIHVTTCSLRRISVTERREFECRLIEHFDPPSNQSTIACPILR
jgi:hypothetical protein